MNVQTVFRVGETTIDGRRAAYKGVEAVGQDAVEAIRKAYPDQKIVLRGFEINGEFKKVDLSTENTIHFNPEKKIRLIKKNS